MVIVGGTLEPNEVVISAISRQKSPCMLEVLALGLAHKRALDGVVVPVGEKAINLAVENLNNDNLGNQDIFDLCNPLLSLSIPERYDFVKKLNVNNTVMNHVYEYLKIVDLNIKYDYEVKFDDFLSESINQIMGVVDNFKKVCFNAGAPVAMTEVKRLITQSREKIIAEKPIALNLFSRLFLNIRLKVRAPN